MFENALWAVIERTLGKYLVLEEMRKKDLNASLWNGKIALDNLEIRREAIDLGLPCVLRKGTVGKVRMKVPWKNLSTESITVDISQIYIVLSWVTQPATREEDAENAQDLKKEKLSFYEKQKEAKVELEKSLRDDDEGGGKKKKGFFGKKMDKMVDNFQLNLSDIHIRFEDEVSEETPFAYGITLERFSVVSANSNWEAKDTKELIKKSQREQKDDKYFYKILEVSQLCFYWMPGDKALFSSKGQTDSKSAVAKKLSDYITRKDKKSSLTYLVRPVDMSIRLTLNTQYKDDDPYCGPKLQPEIAISSVNVELDKEQYRNIISELHTATIYYHRAKLWNARPIHRPLERQENAEHKRKDIRLWWQYSLEAIRLMYSKSWAGWDPKQIDLRRVDRINYQRVIMLMKKGGFRDADVKMRNDIELRYSAEDLIMWREGAYNKLNNETSLKAPGKGSIGGPQNAKNAKELKKANEGKKIASKAAAKEAKLAAKAAKGKKGREESPAPSAGSTSKPTTPRAGADTSGESISTGKAASPRKVDSKLGSDKLLKQKGGRHLIQNDQTQRRRGSTTAPPPPAPVKREDGSGRGRWLGAMRKAKAFMLHENIMDAVQDSGDILSESTMEIWANRKRSLKRVDDVEEPDDSIIPTASSSSGTKIHLTRVDTAGRSVMVAIAVLISKIEVSLFGSRATGRKCALEWQINTIRLMGLKGQGNFGINGSIGSMVANGYVTRALTDGGKTLLMQTKKGVSRRFVEFGAQATFFKNGSKEICAMALCTPADVNLNPSVLPVCVDILNFNTSINIMDIKSGVLSGLTSISGSTKKRVKQIVQQARGADHDNQDIDKATQFFVYVDVYAPNINVRELPRANVDGVHALMISLGHLSIRNWRPSDGLMHDAKYWDHDVLVLSELAEYQNFVIDFYDCYSRLITIHEDESSSVNHVLLEKLNARIVAQYKVTNDPWIDIKGKDAGKLAAELPTRFIVMGAVDHISFNMSPDIIAEITAILDSYDTTVKLLMSRPDISHARSSVDASFAKVSKSIRPPNDVDTHRRFLDFGFLIHRFTVDMKHRAPEVDELLYACLERVQLKVAMRNQDIDVGFSIGNIQVDDQITESTQGNLVSFFRCPSKEVFVNVVVLKVNPLSPYYRDSKANISVQVVVNPLEIKYRREMLLALMNLDLQILSLLYNRGKPNPPAELLKFYGGKVPEKRPRTKKEVKNLQDVDVVDAVHANVESRRSVRMTVSAKVEVNSLKVIIDDGEGGDLTSMTISGLSIDAYVGPKLYGGHMKLQDVLIQDHINPSSIYKTIVSKYDQASPVMEVNGEYNSMDPRVKIFKCGFRFYRMKVILLRMFTSDVINYVAGGDIWPHLQRAIQARRAVLTMNAISSVSGFKAHSIYDFDLQIECPTVVIPVSSYSEARVEMNMGNIHVNSYLQQVESREKTTVIVPTPRSNRGLSMLENITPTDKSRYHDASTKVQGVVPVNIFDVRVDSVGIFTIFGTSRALPFVKDCEMSILGSTVLGKNHGVDVPNIELVVDISNIEVLLSGEQFGVLLRIFRDNWGAEGLVGDMESDVLMQLEECLVGELDEYAERYQTIREDLLEMRRQRRKQEQAKVFMNTAKRAARAKFATGSFLNSMKSPSGGLSESPAPQTSVDTPDKVVVPEKGTKWSRLKSAVKKKEIGDDEGEETSSPRGRKGLFEWVKTMKERRADGAEIQAEMASQQETKSAKLKKKGAKPQEKVDLVEIKSAKPLLEKLNGTIAVRVAITLSRASLEINKTYGGHPKPIFFAFAESCGFRMEVGENETLRGLIQVNRLEIEDRRADRLIPTGHVITRAKVVQEDDGDDAMDEQVAMLNRGGEKKFEFPIFGSKFHDNRKMTRARSDSQGEVATPVGSTAPVMKKAKVSDMSLVTCAFAQDDLGAVALEVTMTTCRYVIAADFPKAVVEFMLTLPSIADGLNLQQAQVKTKKMRKKKKKKKKKPKTVGKKVVLANSPVEKHAKAKAESTSELEGEAKQRLSPLVHLKPVDVNLTIMEQEVYISSGIASSRSLGIRFGAEGSIDVCVHHANCVLEISNVQLFATKPKYDFNKAFILVSPINMGFEGNLAVPQRRIPLGDPYELSLEVDGFIDPADVFCSYQDLRMMQRTVSCFADSETIEKARKLLKRQGTRNTSVGAGNSSGGVAEEEPEMEEKSDEKIDDDEEQKSAQGGLAASIEKTIKLVHDLRGNVSFKSKIHLFTEGLMIVLVNDCRGRHLPLLQARLYELSMLCEGFNLDITSTANFASSFNFYNPFVMNWEPILEPFTSSMKVKVLEEAPFFRAHLHSPNHLNMNLSTACVNALISAYKVWHIDFTEDSPPFDNLSYVIRNESGVPFRLTVSNNQDWRPFIVMPGSEVVATSPMVRNDSHVMYPRQTGMMVSVEMKQKDDEKVDRIMKKFCAPIKDIPCHVPGDQVYNVEFSSDGKSFERSTIVVSVQDNGASRYLMVRSPVMFENDTDDMIEMIIQTKGEKLDPRNTGVEIPGHKRGPLPLHDVDEFVNGDKQVMISFQNRWSLPFSWTEFKARKSFEHIQCSKNFRGQSSDAVFSVNVEAEVTAYEYHGVTKNVLGFEFRKKEIGSCEKVLLTFMPTVVVENLLPCEVQLEISRDDGDRSAQESIEPGDRACTYVYSEGQATSIKIRIDGYEWSDPIPIDTLIKQAGRTKKREKFAMRSGTKGMFITSASSLSPMGGTLILALYANYWINNMTGLPLAYARNDTSKVAATDRDSFEIPRGELKELAHGSYDFSFHPKRVSMLTFEKDGMFKNKMRIAHDSGDGKEEWSKEFGMDAIGGLMNTVLLPKHETYVNPQEIGVSVSLAGGIFSRTRVITLAPRYFIVNANEDDNVEFRVGAADPVTLAPRSTIAVPEGIETRAKSTFVCRVSNEDNTSEWSGPIPVDGDGTLLVNLPYVLKDQSVVGNFGAVAISSKGPAKIITIEEGETRPPPYIIDNSSKYLLKWRQSPKEQWSVAAPSQKSKYCWYDWTEQVREIHFEVFEPLSTSSAVSLKALGSFTMNPDKFDSRSSIGMGHGKHIGFKQGTKGSSLVLKFTTNKEEHNKKEKAKKSVHHEASLIRFRMDIANVGISLVNNMLREELCFFSLKSVYNDVRLSNAGIDFKMLILNAQLDDQCHHSMFPVIVGKEEEYSDLPFFELKMKLNWIKAVIEDIEQRSCPVSINIQEGFVDRVGKFIEHATRQQIRPSLFLEKKAKASSVLSASLMASRKKQAVVKTHTKSTGRTFKLHRARENVMTSILRIQSLLIHPIFMTLSIRFGTAADEFKRLAIKEGRAPSKISSLTNMLIGMSVDQAPLNMKSLSIEDSTISLSDFIRKVATFYGFEMARSMFVVLGSTDIIKNPISTIGTKVLRIFDSEKADRIQQNNLMKRSEKALTMVRQRVPRDLTSENSIVPYRYHQNVAEETEEVGEVDTVAVAVVQSAGESSSRTPRRIPSRKSMAAQDDDDQDAPPKPIKIRKGIRPSRDTSLGEAQTEDE